MAYTTRKQARDLLKTEIDAIADTWTVYTNIFERGKSLPSINIVPSGHANYIDAYDSRALTYNFDIYVLAKLEAYTTDSSGTDFDDGLDDAMDAVDAKNIEVLDSIHSVIDSLGDSSIIRDYTDGNNRIIGLRTQVQVSANR